MDPKLVIDSSITVDSMSTKVKPIPTLKQIEEQFKKSAEYLGILSSAQYYKIARHSYKGFWDDITLKQAIEGLQEELEELWVALNNENNGATSQDIIYEAADVANYLAIIVGLCTRKEQLPQSSYQVPYRDYTDQDLE